MSEKINNLSILAQNKKLVEIMQRICVLQEISEDKLQVSPVIKDIFLDAGVIEAIGGRRYKVNIIEEQLKEAVKIAEETILKEKIERKKETREKELFAFDDVVPSELKLEDLLEKNLEHIETGLKLFYDEKGNSGRQYSIDRGIIDLLCIDKDGKFVVLELKKEKGGDKTIGQITRYMGLVKANLVKNKEGQSDECLAAIHAASEVIDEKCNNGEGRSDECLAAIRAASEVIGEKCNNEEVRGIVIAHEFDEKLEYAASMVNNVEVKYYKIEIGLEVVPQKDRKTTLFRKQAKIQNFPVWK